MAFFCYRCGNKVNVDHKIGRESTCPECSSYLHCCRNCKDYNPLVHWECNETEIEWVADKASGNFCDYFMPAEKFSPPDTRRVDARKKLEALFNKNKKQS